MQKVKGNESEQADRLGSSSVYAYLYPNMMINRYGPWMDTNVVIPQSESYTLVQTEIPECISNYSPHLVPSHLRLLSGRSQMELF